jgi:hypothetical protein
MRKAIHGPALAGGKRVDHSGIKHFVTNKARIPGQDLCMDRNPCLLIVPIMTAENARDWDGGEYEAIVLMDQWKEKDGSVKVSLAEVASGTNMGKDLDGPLATMAEIETARDFLQFLLLAIFTAHGKPPEGAPVPTGLPTITVPLSLKPDLETPRVRKIKFAAHRGDMDLHPAPDPILLASKAAVVFSTRHDQPLAAAAEPQDDDEWTDLDELEAENYLEWRQERIREESESKLINTFLGRKEGTTANTIEISP